MYNRFFGFKERPFKLVPNPEFVYLSRVHEEVLAHLNYAAGFGEGFVAITGEVGTGKTTLCRMFLESLDENTPAAYIFNPKLNALQLLKTINDEFGIASDTDSVKTLIDRLNAFLLEQKAQGKRVILLVDEAQNLSTDVLEQLRLLSNLETTTSKLLQIILVGQPELGELLDTEELRQLNQRITLRYHLIPLNQTETREYIRHRIHIASQKPGLEFTDRAHRSIFHYTSGVPRLINIACERALLTAFTLGKHRITNRIVKRALRELDSKPSPIKSPLLRREKLIIALLSVLVILVAGLVVGQTMRNHSDRPAPLPVVRHKIVTPSAPTTLASGSPEAVKPDTQDVVAPPPPVPTAATPVASPEPSPAEPTSPPVSQANRDLASVIAAVDTINSRDQALSAVLSAWNGPIKAGPADVLDNSNFFQIAARQNGMEALRVKGNLNLIRKLNLPAIVEFPHPDGDVRFLAVVGLSEADIRLSDGQADLSTPHATMQATWNGVAHILWKDFFNYTGVIPITSPGEVIIALKVHLKDLGFPIGAMDAAYDTFTRQAVETIQARNGLDADGKVGPQTKIVLYNSDLSLDIPRLVPPPTDSGFTN